MGLNQCQQLRKDHRVRHMRWWQVRLAIETARRNDFGLRARGIAPTGITAMEAAKQSMVIAVVTSTPSVVAIAPAEAKVTAENPGICRIRCREQTNRQQQHPECLHHHRHHFEGRVREFGGK